MGMDEYDRGSRYLAKMEPTDFFPWLLCTTAPPFRRWYDPRHSPSPISPSRIGDTLAELENPADPSRPVAVGVEFQTENDAEILERKLEYIAHAKRELRRSGYMVFGAVVNLTGPAQPNRLDDVMPGRPDLRAFLQIELRALRDEDAVATLDAIAAGRAPRCLLGWIPLMHGGGESAIMKRWKKIAAAEPDAVHRADHGYLARLFSELTAHHLAWVKALEGWNVRQSQVAEEVREEGRKKGEIETRRATVLEMLEQRFGSPIPKNVQRVIDSTKSVAKLKRLFSAAISANSLDEFRAALRP
jgi:hypothetical protein